jgi:hypothetical protein
MGGPIMTMTIEHSGFQMVKVTILTMTIIPLLSSSSYGQIVKMNRYFKNLNKFQQFQQQKKSRTKKSETVEMVMINFALTISTMVCTSIWPNGHKIVVIGPPLS